MTKLISRETKDAVIKLRFEENLSFVEISKRAGIGRAKVSELCKEEESRREREAKEEDREKEKSRTAQEKEVEAFELYAQGKKPLDLVTSGFATSEEAEDLWGRFVRLKSISDRPPGYLDGYKAGYGDAKKGYQIGIPCCRCGDVILLERGEDIVSDLQNLIYEVVKENFTFVNRNGNRTTWNWHHTKCPEQKG